MVHWNAAKRVMKYIKGILHFGVAFEQKENCPLSSFSDAAWAREVDGIKSTSGYTFNLGSGVIS